MVELSLNIPSPVQEIHMQVLTRQGVRLLVKRDDLIHSTISGNKWRKLKGNIAEIQNENFSGLITFGGAFSNHIHATAAAGMLYQVPTLGIIRGEYDPYNPTLRFAQEQGMKLKFVSRSAYRDKEDSAEVQRILAEYQNYFLVPEGGSSPLAMKGLAELAEEIDLLQQVDLISVSAGTGRTAAGIILHQDRPVLVMSALKSGYLAKEIKHLVGSRSFAYNTDYHFGGYGKVPAELVTFINNFYLEHHIPLDPIYNAKAMYGLLDMVRNGKLERGTTVLHIHTGGLQGVDAYNYMASKRGKASIDTQK